MAKEAVLQVRMDAEIKEKAELLFRSLGTSFTEAVRMFAKRSLDENGMPFQLTANKGQAFGIASGYADAGLIEKEAAYLAKLDMAIEDAREHGVYEYLGKDENGKAIFNDMPRKAAL